MGNVLVGSALVSVRGGGHGRRLVVVIHSRCRPFLSSFVAVRGSLLSIFVLVRHAFLNGFASLVLRLAMGDVHGGVVALVVGVCPVVAGGVRWWVSWVLVVVCGSLCPLHVLVGVIRRLWCCVGRLFLFLDAWDRLTGWRLCNVTWERHGGEADAGCHWAVCRGCGRRHWRGGCSLKKPRHNGVTLASCSTRT